MCRAYRRGTFHKKSPSPLRVGYIFSESEPERDFFVFGSILNFNTGYHSIILSFKKYRLHIHYNNTRIVVAGRFSYQAIMMFMIALIGNIVHIPMNQIITLLSKRQFQ